MRRAGTFLLYRLFPALAALTGVVVIAERVFAPGLLPRFLPEAFASAAAFLAAAYALAAGRFLRERAFYARECGGITRECERLIEANRALERRVEGLSIMREIHRTGNINSKAERIRKILEVISDIAESEDSILFRIDRDRERPTPVAYYNRRDGEELFIRFSAPVESPASYGFKALPELRLRDRLEFRAELVEGEDRIGEAELTVHLDERAAPPPEGGSFLENALARAVVDDSFVAEAILSKRPVKAEIGGGVSVLSYPLIAENELVGAMKVRLSRPEAELLRLADIQQILEESASHIAIAMKKEEEAERSIRDELTGLFVKRHFWHELRSHFDAARASGRPLSLMMIDIDHFKRVNDKFGHVTGDTALKGAASVLKKAVRSADLAFRYGGEELSVVLPGATLESAAITAERVRSSIAEAVFLSEEKEVVPVTVSVGVAEMTPEVTSARALVNLADEALYRSKRRGRNRVSLWPARRSKKVRRKGRPRGRRSA